MPPGARCGWRQTRGFGDNPRPGRRPESTPNRLMTRPRSNSLTLLAALLLACPAACAQGLVVRQPDAAPAGAPQEPKGDAELQQELRALREQTAQLEALVQQLQQREKSPQGDDRDGRRQDEDEDRMRRMEQERFEREQQDRKRAAADHIAQVEKRMRDEMARIKQNGENEIKRIKDEAGHRPEETRRDPAERSPMFVRSRMVEGQPMEERVVEVRRESTPQRLDVQMFEVDEQGLPVRRVQTRERRIETRMEERRDEPCCECDCASCGRGSRAHMERRLDDPEIERLLEALRKRISERRQDPQFRGRVVPPQTAPRVEQRSWQPEAEGQPRNQATDEPQRDGGR